MQHNTPPLRPMQMGLLPIMICLIGVVLLGLGFFVNLADVLSSLGFPASKLYSQRDKLSWLSFGAFWSLLGC